MWGRYGRLICNIEHYSSKIHKRFYTNFCFGILIFTLYLSLKSLLLFLFRSMKLNSRFHLNCCFYFDKRTWRRTNGFSTRAKYKLCILKYFAKFGLIFPKIYLHQRTRYFATTADRKIKHSTFKKGRIALNVLKDFWTPFLPRGEKFF